MASGLSERALGTFGRWEQTAAVMEVVHSATGVVRSPLVTTVLQVRTKRVVVEICRAPRPRPGKNKGHSADRSLWI